MSDILAKLAGNKTIAQLAFKQIKKYIKEENITMICIFVDNNGEITAKQYNEPVAVLKTVDAQKLLQDSNTLKELTEKHLNELNNG